MWSSICRLNTRKIKQTNMRHRSGINTNKFPTAYKYFNQKNYFKPLYVSSYP